MGTILAHFAAPAQPMLFVCRGMLRARAGRGLIWCFESDAVTNLGLQAVDCSCVENRHLCVGQAHRPGPLRRSHVLHAPVGPGARGGRGASQRRRFQPHRRWHAVRSAAPLDHPLQRVAPELYNDFDIIFGPVFVHFLAPPRPIRAVYYALLRARADLVLVGAWNPTL